MHTKLLLLTLLALNLGCSSQNSMSGKKAPGPDFESAGSSEASADSLNAHPRDPNKPGDNEESIPGYLTNPDLASAVYDQETGEVEIVADRGFVESDSDEVVIVGVWHVDYDKSQADKSNGGLFGFLSGLGSKILQTLLPSIFGEPAPESVSAELIETLEVSPGEGFSASVTISEKDIVVISVAEASEPDQLPILNNESDRNRQVLYSPALDRGFVAFDKEDLKTR